MSLLEDITTRLENQSVATITVDLFEGKLPPTPDKALAISEKNGQKPIRAMSRRTAERPNVHFVARGATYDEALTLAKNAFNAVDVCSGPWIGTRYLFIEALSSLIHLGPDEHQRDMFSCTFRATVGA